MANWQDLVSGYGFTNGQQSVKRNIHKRRGSQLPQATAVILTAPGEEAQGRLRHGADGARSASRQVPTDTLVRDDARA